MAPISRLVALTPTIIAPPLVVPAAISLYIMGLKKAWIYDSVLPDALAEELRADGFERPSSPGLRASFEEKQAALESYSLTASGDLVLQKEHEWPRVSVASRGHQLKTRTKKTQAKSRRWTSDCLDEQVRRELGLDEYGMRLEEGNEGGGNDGERPLYLSPRFPNLDHKRTVSEPIIINTVDDLMRHLEKIGRLQPALPSPSIETPSMPTDSPAPSVTGSETEVESGDGSFVSCPSTESEVSDVVPVHCRAPTEA